jgi:hypothetical protein
MIRELVIEIPHSDFDDVEKSFLHRRTGTQHDDPEQNILLEERRRRMEHGFLYNFIMDIVGFANHGVEATVNNFIEPIVSLLWLVMKVYVSSVRLHLQTKILYTCAMILYLETTIRYTYMKLYYMKIISLRFGALLLSIVIFLSIVVAAGETNNGNESNNSDGDVRSKTTPTPF